MRNFLIFAAFLMIFVGCGSGGSTKTAKPQPFKFTMPNLPMYVQSEEEANEWMGSNYWNTLDPTDSTAIGSDALKDAYGSWVAGLVHMPTNKSTAIINAQIERLEAHPPMLEEFLRLGEGFLGDPTSEIRHDSLFIAILDYQLNSPKLTELEKLRPQRLKKLTLQNRPGTIGPDVSWTTMDGTKNSLYAQRPQHTLIMFYTPGCASCADIFKSLHQDPFIHGLIDAKKLRAVALYTDNDLEKWREYAPSIPPYWENGYTDESFKTNELYALRATPSIYILDKNRKVLVKDGASHLELLFAINK